MASLWQQAGRAGRREQPSTSIYIAFDGPLDQFFMKQPEKLFGRAIECAQVPCDTVLFFVFHKLDTFHPFASTPLMTQGSNTWQAADLGVGGGREGGKGVVYINCISCICTCAQQPRQICRSSLALQPFLYSTLTGSRHCV